MRGFRYYKKILIITVLIIVATLFGIAGYMLIEDYSFIDAFYMTIITMSTVGFLEVAPLSDAGRIFTSVLIVTNIGIFFYGVTTIGGFIIEGEFRNFYKNYNVIKKIEQLNNHVIVCGYGRNGKQVCEELLSKSQPFVVVENKASIIEELKNREDILFIEGNATEDEILLNAGIKKAKSIITTLPADPDNVYVVLCAHELNPDLMLISRASNEESVSKLKRAGAHYVIMPEKIGGTHMATLVMEPDIMDFISQLTGQDSDISISFEEFSLDNAAIGDMELTIKDLDIRNKSGANVIGLKTGNGKFIVNPPADAKLTRDAKLIVLGSEDQIKGMRELIDGL